MGEVSGLAEWSTKVTLHPTAVGNEGVQHYETGLLLHFFWVFCCVLFFVFLFSPFVSGQPMRDAGK